MCGIYLSPTPSPFPDTTMEMPMITTTLEAVFAVFATAVLPSTLKTVTMSSVPAALTTKPCKYDALFIPVLAATIIGSCSLLLSLTVSIMVTLAYHIKLSKLKRKIALKRMTATSSKSPGTSKSHAAQPGLKDEAHGVDGGYSLPDAKKKDSSRTESQEPQVNVHDQPHVIPGMIPDVYVPGPPKKPGIRANAKEQVPGLPKKPPGIIDSRAKVQEQVQGHFAGVSTDGRADNVQEPPVQGQIPGMSRFHGLGPPKSIDSLTGLPEVVIRSRAENAYRRSNKTTLPPIIGATLCMSEDKVNTPN